MGTDALRRKLALLLVGLADALHPTPGIAGLSNIELDAQLARKKRQRRRRGR